ncbi:MAG: hypothetical protein OQK81_05220, partial [Candidatus Bathyarchaeota archaeon]|nr:hypothetical protein [Candidatus Bathyarchaeota archaeon]
MLAERYKKDTASFLMFNLCKPLKSTIMDLKKTYKVNLEKKKGFHLFLGLIITLSLILISFEWTSETTRLQDLNSGNEISVDEIIMPILRREEVKPLPKPELPPIAKV